MAETVYKQRVAKKQSSETKPQESSVESSSQVSPRPIFAEALFIREFQRMSAENKRLREENNELVEREERRKEKDRQRKLKKRQDNREEYNTYMRELYARKQQQSKQST